MNTSERVLKMIEDKEPKNDVRLASFRVPINARVKLFPALKEYLGEQEKMDKGLKDFLCQKF